MREYDRKLRLLLRSSSVDALGESRQGNECPQRLKTNQRIRTREKNFKKEREGGQSE